MDLIDTLYAWMTGTLPARAGAAGVIAMLVVQAGKPWLSAPLYKPVAGFVALVVCLALEVATGSVTPQGLILAALLGLGGGLLSSGLYEWAKDMPLLGALVKRS